jgi:hypothetical protein
MVRLSDIENAIRNLSQEELARFREWFADFDAQVWDRQLRDDVASSRLDSLADEAIKDHREGRSTEL